MACGFTDVCVDCSGRGGAGCSIRGPQCTKIPSSNLDTAPFLYCEPAYTFVKDTNSGRHIWWFEYASLILWYEARLKTANKIRYRCGTFDRYFLQHTKAAHVVI
jgi:hypothetical protein